MTLPGVQITPVAGTLSVTGPAASIPLVVGPSSAGIPNTVYTFSQVATISATIGDGPAQLLASAMLADNGGTVQVIPCNASIAATTSLITSGSGYPAVTVAGTPLNTYQFVMNITTAGALGTSRFQYSLDGGLNFSPSILTTASFVMPRSGLTLTMPAGSYTTAQSYSFTTTAPVPNATDLTTALNVMTGSSFNTAPSVLAIAVDTQSVTSGSALFPVVDAALTALRQPSVGLFVGSCFIPTGGASSFGSSTIAGATAAAAGVNYATAGNMISLVAERVTMVAPDPFMGYGNPLVPYAYDLADTEQGLLISTNPAWIALGGNARFGNMTWDETQNGEVYNPFSIVAPMSQRGYGNSVFPNQGWLKSPNGSPYQYVPWGRVLNTAASVMNVALKKYINSFVRVLKNGTGYIDPRDAQIIINDVQSQLNSAIMEPTNAEGTKGHASAVTFTINQTTNLLASPTLYCNCSIVPLANLSNLKVSLGFASAVPVVAG